MIQAACVGVGVVGGEGAQAVMAADFAVTRFQDLHRLVMIHGYWSYTRLVKVVLHFFYKNCALILVLFWFQPCCAFSGQGMILPLHLLLSTFLYTSLPAVIVGVFDQDTPAQVLLSTPTKYWSTRTGVIYTRRHFWTAILEAVYHSAVIFCIAYGVYTDSQVGLWEFGSFVCTACVLVMLAQLAIQVTNWTILHLLSFLLSLLLYFTVGFGYSSVCSSCQGYLVMQSSMGDMKTHLATILILTLSILPRLLVTMMRKCKNRAKIS